MNKLSNIRFAPMVDSIYIKPYTMIYEQDGKEKTWDMMKLHDSVSILIYNVSRNVLVFVRQFRPGTYVSHISEEDKKKPICTRKYPAKLGLTLELCAGIVDKNKSLIEIAKEELLEECGYDVPLEKIQKIHSWIGSIGISGNVVNTYFCEVTDDMKVSAGGGIDDEMIEVVEMTVDEVKKYLQSNLMQSPGSMIATIYWFLLNKYNNYCH